MGLFASKRLEAIKHVELPSYFDSAISALASSQHHERILQIIFNVADQRCPVNYDALARFASMMVRGGVAIQVDEPSSPHTPAPHVLFATFSMYGQRSGSFSTLREQALGQARAALAHNSAALRLSAARFIGSARAAQSASALIALIGCEPNHGVRRAAAEALGRLGDPAAVPDLRERLRADENWSVRQAAAQALGRLGDPAAVPDLLERLRSDDEPWNVRSGAAGALGRLGNTTGLSELVQSAANGDRSSSLGITAVLWAAGWPEVDNRLQMIIQSSMLTEDIIAAFAEVVGGWRGRLLSRNADGVGPFFEPGTALTYVDIKDHAYRCGVTIEDAVAFYRRVAPHFRFRLLRLPEP
jgi:hypothetical protein